MGTGIRISCQHCDYEKQFRLGVGMNYSCLENVMDCLHNPKKKEIKNILKNHVVMSTHFEHFLFRCRKCNQLFERFDVKIMYKRGDELETYKTVYNCPKCKHQLRRVRKYQTAEKFPCPECQKSGLQVCRHLCWD